MSRFLIFMNNTVFSCGSMTLMQRVKEGEEVASRSCDSGTLVKRFSSTKLIITLMEIESICLIGILKGINNMHPVKFLRTLF